MAILIVKGVPLLDIIILRGYFLTMAIFERKTTQSKKGHSISIRSADRSDAGEIIKFDMKTLESSNHFHMTPDEMIWPSEEQVQNRIARFETEPGSLILLAEDQNQLIGKIEFKGGQRKTTAHSGYLDMAVHPDWRNQGLGIGLLGSLIEWAVAHPKIEILKLDVVEKNIPAVQLYKKFGFKEIGRDSFATKINGEFQTDLTLLLKLDK